MKHYVKHYIYKSIIINHCFCWFWHVARTTLAQPAPPEPNRRERICWAAVSSMLMRARTIRYIIGAHLGLFLSIRSTRKGIRWQDRCNGNENVYLRWPFSTYRSTRKGMRWQQKMVMKECTCAGLCARALIPAFAKSQPSLPRHGSDRHTLWYTFKLQHDMIWILSGHTM